VHPFHVAMPSKCGGTHCEISGSNSVTGKLCFVSTTLLTVQRQKGKVVLSLKKLLGLRRKILAVHSLSLTLLVHKNYTWLSLGGRFEFTPSPLFTSTNTGIHMLSTLTSLT